MRISLIILFLILSRSFFAQPPAIDDSIMSIKGKWTRSQNIIVDEDEVKKMKAALSEAGTRR